MDSHQLHHLHRTAADVVELCHSAGHTIATAESLTAGLCAATLAEIPGASAVLRGGLIVYATELKHTLAGVDEELLREYGPVHPDIASQLAIGAALQCGASIGIGLTGVAGPEPQDGHPVGEVYVGVSVGEVASVKKMDATVATAQKSEDQRALIRQLAVKSALLEVVRRITG